MFDVEGQIVPAGVWRPAFEGGEEDEQTDPSLLPDLCRQIVLTAGEIRLAQRPPNLDAADLTVLVLHGHRHAGNTPTVERSMRQHGVCRRPEQACRLRMNVLPRF